MSRGMAVTGMGMLHSSGRNWGQCWENLCAGQMPPVAPPGVLAIRDFNVDERLDHEQTRRMDRVSQILTVMVHDLIREAALERREDLERTGLCVSTEFGVIDTIVSFSERVKRLGPQRANPMEFPNTVMNASAGHACIVEGVRGHNNTLAGYGALAEAHDALLLGRAPAMLAAGLEEAGPYQQQTVSQYASPFPTPFAPEGGGVWLGEGAAGLFLETEQSALTRGAKRYARYLGYEAGFTAQADRDGHAGINGLRRSIESLLEKTQCPAGALAGMVVAGTGSVRQEARVLGALGGMLKGRSAGIPVFPLAGMMGVLGGAEECFGAVIACAALAGGQWPGVTWLADGLSRCLPEGLTAPQETGPLQDGPVLLVAAHRDGVHFIHLFEKVV